MESHRAMNMKWFYHMFLESSCRLAFAGHLYVGKYPALFCRTVLARYLGGLVNWSFAVAVTDGCVRKVAPRLSAL